LLLPTKPELLLVTLTELTVALLVLATVFESSVAAVVPPPEDAASEHARAKDPDSTRPLANETSFSHVMAILQASMVLPKATRSDEQSPIRA